MPKYSFFTHPNQVCMTYFQHFKFATLMSKDLFIGSLQSMVHAIFPSVYITSTSDLNKKITEKLNNSGCRGSN